MFSSSLSCVIRKEYLKLFNSDFDLCKIFFTDDDDVMEETKDVKFTFLVINDPFVFKGAKICRKVCFRISPMSIEFFLL